MICAACSSVPHAHGSLTSVAHPPPPNSSAKVAPRSLIARHAWRKLPGRMCSAPAPLSMLWIKLVNPAVSWRACARKAVARSGHAMCQSASAVLTWETSAEQSPQKPPIALDSESAVNVTAASSHDASLCGVPCAAGGSDAASTATTMAIPAAARRRRRRSDIVAAFTMARSPCAPRVAMSKHKPP